MQTDDELLKLLQSGHERAYNELVVKYSSRVYNLCLRLLPSKQDAEDLTQEVFTTLFLSLPTFRNDSALYTWIHRITLNKCHEFNRKKQRKKRSAVVIHLDELNSDKKLGISLTPDAILEEKELSMFLENIIHSLPENQRNAYILSKFEGNKNEHIAAIMNLSISAVESLLFRAKKTVIRELFTFLNRE